MRVAMKTPLLWSTVIAGFIAALGACEPAESYGNAVCPPGGTSLTYETFGRPFITAHCDTCHGKGVRDRQGAPDKYIFETQAQVKQWAGRIYDDSAGNNTSMPPGPVDPPESERDDLAEWLACGAP